MASFTLTDKFLAVGVNNRQLIVVTGLLNVGVPLSDSETEGVDGLPASLFGLSELCGAFPFLDLLDSLVVPVISVDRQTLYLMVDGALSDVDAENVPITVFGIS